MSALVLLLKSHSAGAHTPFPPDYGVTLGPSFAYAHVPRFGSGLIYGLDAAFVYTLLWGGGGVRSFETLGKDRALLPYVEGGIYLLLNFGIGYTFDTAGGTGDMSGLHLFAGLPVPIDEANHALYFLEPYYRATYDDGPGTLHEVGLLLKWSTRWDEFDGGASH